MFAVCSVFRAPGSEIDTHGGMNTGAFFCHHRETPDDAQTFHWGAKLMFWETTEPLTLDGEVVFWFHHSDFCVGWLSVHSQRAEAKELQCLIRLP